MTAKTVRINLMVSPAEKAGMDARARDAGLSTSELIRRAVAAFEPERSGEEMASVVAEMARAVERVEKKLDQVLEAVTDYQSGATDE